MQLNHYYHSRQRYCGVLTYVGQAVYEGVIIFTAGRGQLNLVETVPGIYMIELKEDKGATRTFRVIIER